FHFLQGGKGANQAVSSATLGAKTLIIASVGDDIFGKEAVESLKDNAVDTSKVMVVHADTGMAFITRTNRDNRIILHEGANHHMQVSKALEAIDGVAGDVLICQYEIPFDIVLEGFIKAKQLGMITILNPAPARYLDKTIFEFVDYLVLNQTECELFTGIYPTHKDDVIKASQRLFDQGVSKLIVTMGSKGAVYIANEHLIEVSAYKVKTKDTTGAGDAFVGGLAYGLVKHQNIESSIKIASAAGAFACLHEGVEHAMGTIEDINKIMEGIK
ncbi:MAG: ribokinase, partial [Tenericutes bacterium HGW-Tenericutes-8]